MSNKIYFKYCIFLFVSLLGSVLNTYLSSLVGEFIDYILAENIRKAIFITFSYLLFLILMFVCKQVSKFKLHNYAWIIFNNIKISISSQSIYAEKQESSSQLLDIIEKDVRILRNFAANTFPSIIGNLFICLTVIVITLRYSFLLGLLFIVWIALSICLLLFFEKGRRSKNYLENNRIAEENLTVGIIETLRLSELIFSLKKQPFFLNRLMGFFETLKHSQINQQKYLYKIWIVALGLVNYAELLFIFVGGLLIIKQRISLGQLYSIFLYIRLLKQPIESIQNLYKNFLLAQNSKARLRKHFKIKAINNSMDEIPGFVLSKKISKINVQNLSFSYLDGSKNNVLKNLSLNFEQGLYLIYGPSGCGKSTFSKILSGHLTKFSGKIDYGKCADKDEIINQILYIENEGFIFGSEIESELDLYNKIDVLETTDCKDVVSYLMKLKEYKPADIRLINILRSLYSGYPVIVFDETFSGLEYSMIEWLIKLIKDEHLEKIIILVSHNVEIRNLLNPANCIDFLDL